MKRIMRSQTERDKFNDCQNQAIEADFNKDILLSAAAGSGKTRTLTERVYTLIDQGLIDPSSLLVLTFTKNAAHEMKERIIKRFANNEDIAQKLESCHIQTFDSFSSYLVTKYAGRLGISDNIPILDTSVVNVKRTEILDEVLDEYYADSTKYERIVKTLKKYNMSDDSSTKAVILDIISELDKLAIEDKNNYLDFAKYEAKFINPELIQSMTDELVKEVKNKIIESMYIAYFYEKHNDFFDLLEDLDIDAALNVFNTSTVFIQDYNNFTFRDDNYVTGIFNVYRDLLTKNTKEFIDTVKDLRANYKTTYPTKGKKKEELDENCPCWKEEYRSMKNVLFGADASCGFIATISSDNDVNIQNYMSKSDDVKIILEIAKEVINRTNDYMKSVNSFTFGDVYALSLRLVTEPQFSDILEEIRARFKYIMVDEYQDANDFQEIFLNAMTNGEAPDDNRAHLFCVGDAKQSIYGFRNSNVGLFRAREKRYLNGEAHHEVITMNYNYRSGPKLMQDINYLFKFYMTETHGAINYANANEQIQYDTKVNLYKEPYDSFGVYRLIPRVIGDDPITIAKAEALAIARDIKNKKENHFKVYDKDKRIIRDCEYDDFAIIMRVRTGFKTYQDVFSKAGIPLNSSIKTYLTELDAIIVIQSLLRFISWILLAEDIDVMHIYASIARSYIYQMNDNDLVTILGACDSKKGNYEAIKETKIYQDVKEFCDVNKDKSFTEIFRNMLNTFGVLDKLYLIGDVSNNVSKIESIYKLIYDNEKIGNGLKFFIELFDTLNRRDLDLASESLYESKGAVDMMTIHASKGLERKIVYLPAAYNKESFGNHIDKPDYTFSKDYGILLPDYSLDMNGEKTSIKDIPSLFYELETAKSNPDRDEHVRLIYVALTRAENMLYIVGNPLEDKRKETLYTMLDSCPHYYQINDDFVNRKIADGIISKQDYTAYKKAIENIIRFRAPLTEKELGPSYIFYVNIANLFMKNVILTRITDGLNNMLIPIFNEYLERLTLPEVSYDIKAKIFAVDRNIYANTLEGLFAFLNVDDDSISPEALDEEIEEENEAPVTIDDLKNMLDFFIEQLVNLDYKALGIKVPKGDDYNGRFKLYCRFIPALAYAFDGITNLLSLSYQTNDFADNVEYIEVSADEIEVEEPALDKLAICDEPIEFPQRFKLRASKIHMEEEDAALRQILDYGVKLHRYLELVDFKTKDTSFIKDEKDKALMDTVLAMDIFKGIENAKVYQEYGYFDEALKTTGFIDLMYELNGVYTIIDYKTKNIDDVAYDSQLHTYQRNVCELFKTDSKHIKLYLLSLIDKRVRKVETEEE